MNFLQIKETSIYSRDLDRARRFYEEKLNLPVISYVKDKHVFFRVGASMLLCFHPDDSRQKQTPPPHYGEGKSHLAFEVTREEYERHKKLVEDAGIPITDRVIWDSGQESFYFEDPDGHVLEIVPVGIWK